MNTLVTDKFYYIMDYSGNCYRVNSNDQLVVAANETEATVFSFVEANKRIGAGPKSKFYFMTPINDKNEEEDDEPIQEEANYNLSDAIISAVKEITDGEITEEVEKSISEYDLSKVDWQEYLTHFTFIASGLKEYRESLVKAESDVDQKICDVLHYIELCNTDDSEATDLVELLKVCRENRRDIKDEIFRVDMFQKNVGTSANVAKATEAIKSIKGLETRKYTPRKFTELFEGSEIKIKCSGRNRIDSYVEISDRMGEQSVQEEYAMDYERIETAFDGKKNDWMAFAMQQAEFYRNAGQYIINLKIEIEDIDNAIADLMDEVETANCNVTQGYKMFKRLKELRLERKEKERELECLYILTEHFDINAMADECDSNVDTLESFLYGDSEKEDTIQHEASAEETGESVVVTSITNIAV